MTRSNFVSTNESAKPKPNDKAPNSNSKSECCFCHGPFHPFYLCFEFKKLAVEDRIKRISELNLCRNCFGANHYSNDCKKQGCKTCSKKHNTLLHRERLLSENTNTQVKGDTFLCSQKNCESGILFPTAVLHIQDKFDKWHECRALLDSASDINFISQEFANSITFRKQFRQKITISSLNQQKTTSNNVVNANIKSISSNYKRNLNFSIVPMIVESLPHKSVTVSRWDIPPNIKLADPYFNLPRRIDLLIGNELFFEILTCNQIKNDSVNVPIFQESLFGWLIVGPYKQVHNFATFSKRSNSNDESELNEIVEKFWKLESIPEKRILTESEKFCEDHFEKNHYRQADGRYVVSLPLTNEADKLGESRSIALRRFSYLENKLQANPELKKLYFNFIEEYRSLGHMTEERSSVNTETNYYLPHHGVLKPTSSTTKLRVVFDASAKTSSKLSLNDVMHVGPKVQSDLFNIILRFRKHLFVITADIAKMYRQVQISPDNTKLQKILWRFDPEDSISTYELQTVTYGTAAAPYLATRALKQLTIDEGTKFPQAARIAQTDFYVDDILTGANTIEEIFKLQSDLVQLLSKGGFCLHKWCSNSEQVLSNIPTDLREVLKEDKPSKQEFMKALGILWKPKQDCFCFNLNLSEPGSICTKRTILSQIAKIYDPLGFLSPVTITAKLIIQLLWKAQIDWDSAPPQDIIDKWKMFHVQLPILNSINIPRCLVPRSVQTIELHGFADASEVAFGACLYVKCKLIDDSITVHLLCSKTRVAPLKVISLPRLELCAAQLLSNLLKTVLDSLQLKFDKITLWTDSLITIHWIKLPTHTLKIFIANRVSEIQELTKDIEWRHVSSENNAADIISRGILPNDLPDSENWWKGPSFLVDESIKPSSNSISSLGYDKGLLELKPEKTCLTIVKSNFEIWSKFSSLTKLIRITALCKPFSHNCKRGTEKFTLPLSSGELDQALLTLTKLVQEEEFYLDIKHLTEDKPINRRSKITGLNPFLDNENKLLRVGGRLSNSIFDYDSKHQLLLPAGHPFTQLIFRHEHLKNFHAGPQLLVSLVRQRFWPLNAKNSAKKIVRNCVICFKNRPILSSQIMGNLPAERVTPNHPFNTTGVDLCGPFLIKNKNQRKGSLIKIYVASFVCFVVKAVHIELVSDLTSEGFLACLNRFLARRGKPKTLWSDNATNFVGGKNILNKNLKIFLSEDDDQRINTFCANEGIDWKFIPPRSPNFGGLWEASIKSLKFHLNRITKTMVFTYEEFNTILIQIEGIMNSRPLTDMSSDPSDLMPLTPAHFLIGRPITALPEPSYETIPSNRLTSWKRISQVIQSFWKRFSIEYIHSLQQRNKWKTDVPNITINDVVLVCDEASPTKWLLGLVTKIIAGNDGKVRVLEVKTKSGTFRRPISKISKLPIN